MHCFCFRGQSAGSPALGAAGPERHNHPGQLGHRARLRENGCRCGLRRRVRSGRGRFQSRRDQLHKRDGAAGGGRGRVEDLSGPANEAFHRARHAEKAVCGKPGMAEDAHECVRRRLKLLPLQAPRSETEGHPAIRAVDGTQLHRGQHRRRYRARESQSAPVVLRQGPREPDALRRRGPARRALRFEWNRHRALEHRRAPCPAADQSAYFVLLPVRTADGERGGTECLWRSDVGPVLHLPGLQRTRRMDAHDERRRCDR